MSAVAESCDSLALDRAQELNHDYHWLLKVASLRLELFETFGQKKDLQEAMTLIARARDATPLRALAEYDERRMDERDTNDTIELPEDFVLITHAERIVDETDLLPL
jgi:hypothetical protein